MYLIKQSFDMKTNIKRLMIITSIIIYSATSVFAALLPVQEGDIQNPISNSAISSQFKVVGDDNTFTLIDTTNGNFVIANDSYGTKEFSSNNMQKFHLNDEGGIAYWLNNEFISAEYSGKKLNDSIINNLVLHSWYTEPGHESGSGTVEYETMCKVALLSVTELNQYSETIGIIEQLNKTADEADEYNFWWTRSPSTRNNQKVMTIDMQNNYILGNKVSNGFLIRPVFYLSDNFFKTVKLDVSYMGKNVKDVLVNLSDTALKSIGYSDEEITIIRNNKSSVMYLSAKPGWSDYKQTDNDRNYVVDNKISFTVDARNESGETLYYYYYWTVNKAKSPVKKVEIAANTDNTNQIKLPIATDGRYKCTLYLSRDGLNFNSYGYEVSFVQSVEGEHRTKGYATHFAHGNPINETIELLKASGVKIVRDGGYWQNIDYYGTGKYDWKTVDSYIKELQRNDIDLIYYLGYGNSNYYTYDENGNRTPFADEKELQAFVNYAVAFAERYPNVTRYEIWNEPNLEYFWGTTLDVETYKKVVKAVSEALKKVNPEIEIIAGVTAGDGSGATVKWDSLLEALLDEDTVTHIDALSFHQYYNFHNRVDQHPNSEETYFDIIKKLMDKKGGFVKLYLTETGAYVTENGNKSLSEKNEELIRIYSEADAHGIDLVTVYDFVQDGIDKTDSEDNYGVITAPEGGFVPTNTYYSVKNYLGMANNAVYMGYVDLHSDVRAHVYLMGEHPVLVVWSNAQYNDDSKIEIDFEKTVSVYDLFNNNVSNGRTVSVGHEPIYVYGLDNSIIAQAVKNIVKDELLVLSEDIDITVEDVVTEIEDIETSEELYSAIISVYKLADRFDLLNNSVLEKSSIARLDTAADYLAKLLSTFDNAKEITKEDIVKAYANYKTTLDTVALERFKGSNIIYNYGLDILTEAEDYVDKTVMLEQHGENYTLKRDKTLAVYGQTTKGSVVNIKIVNSANEIVYIGGVNADNSGLFNSTIPFDVTVGEYELITKSMSDLEQKKVKISVCEDVDYQSPKLKYLYGRLIGSNSLLNLSRNHLFKYTDVGETLLLDIAWKNVSDNSASIVCTFKNGSERKNVNVIMAGYSENGQLSCVEIFENIDLSIKEHTMKLEYDQKPNNFKAFVWDANIIKMLPISNTYDY